MLRKPECENPDGLCNAVCCFGRNTVLLPRILTILYLFILDVRTLYPLELLLGTEVF